jgi:hypothetical protein
MLKHDLIMAVKELMERHLEVYEIASRLHIPLDVVQSIISTLV